MPIKFEFNKISEKLFEKKKISMWMDEDEIDQIVYVTDYRVSEDNDCSSAAYKIVQIHGGCFEFILVTDWSEDEFPRLIEGETEFRRMINKLPLRNNYGQL